MFSGGGGGVEAVAAHAHRGRGFRGHAIVKDYIYIGLPSYIEYYYLTSIQLLRRFIHRLCTYLSSGVSDGRGKDNAASWAAGSVGTAATYCEGCGGRG